MLIIRPRSRWLVVSLFAENALLLLGKWHVWGRIHRVADYFSRREAISVAVCKRARPPYLDRLSERQFLGRNNENGT